MFLTSVVAAGRGVIIDDRGAPTISAPVRDQALMQLNTVAVVAARPASADYDRSAFGSAWSDEVTVTGGGNGCDTRNDILARDLDDTTRAATKNCPTGVTAGEFRSPYTGKFLTFSRDRAAGAIQIDHIVPLAYAWAMGANTWPAQRRLQFANDPANLVAVDGRSNQDKSDAEPARWMPPNRGFHCQYAAEFVAVISGYRLSIDEPSREVLRRVLRGC